MNNTIDFNTAKTIGTMSKKIDHIDDTVSSFFSFMGVGNFFGILPDTMQDSRLYGV